MVVNDYACLLAKRGVLEFIVGTPPGASSLLQGLFILRATTGGHYLNAHPWCRQIQSGFIHVPLE
ncbi:hypothetical protein D9M73_144750 [compost metagenome]|nr:hypothetical protein BSF40_05510 [Pseudomonas sp. ACN5]